MNKKIEIINLLKKTKRALGAKEQDDDYYDIAARKCEKFGVECVRDVLEFWVERKIYMPKISELISECKSSESFHESKTQMSLADSICKYYCSSEHEISRRMCQKKFISEDDAFLANLNFGKTLCVWHYQCAYAKAHPRSSIAQFVKNHLKNMKRFYESGSDSVKSSNKGGYSAVLTKINTDARARL